MDWYEAYADLDGERIKLQAFLMRSMASGAAFHRAYPCATQQAFLEAHELAFAYFEGVFRRLCYDNLSSAVRKILRGQPIVVNGVSATYDALGRMVEAGSGSTYVQVIFRPSGDKLAVVQNGVLSKGTVPLPGGASAIYNASGLSYIRHKDWLGSSRLATTWNHAVYAKEAYAPFGEAYNEAGTADRSFTGQDQDTTQGIYDFLYRRYDPTAGRWMSPDPSGWSAVNLSAPQSLNRYAYALNNPLRLTDPTGLDPSDPSTCDDYQGVCSSEDAANQGLANGYGYNGEEPIILRNDDGSILTLQVGYRTGAPLHRQTHS